MRLRLSVLLCTAAPLALGAQVPWSVGETLEYGGSYRVVFPIGVGHAATLTVAGIDTIGGVPYWKFTFNFSVSVPLYHNRSQLTSWTSVNGLVSRHFIHNVDESNYSKHFDWTMVPDSGYYRNVGDPSPQPTPRDPLDDVAFFYYLRLPTTRLEIGQTFTINRYFKGDRNPVTITVLKREECELPNDVKAQCLVLNPIVNDPPHGMFMKDQNARIWITDDARRIPVKIKSGSSTMTIRKITPGRGGH